MAFLAPLSELENKSTFGSDVKNTQQLCTPSALTSGARDGVRLPNVDETLPPVGHVDRDGVHSELDSMSERGTLALIIFQTMEK